MPLLIFMVPAVMVERLSYAAGAVFLISGLCLAIMTTVWIECRRITGTGAFSTKRSERFLRRLSRSQVNYDKSQLSDE